MSQSFRNTLLLHRADQLVRSAKTEKVCVSNWGSDINWMEQYHILKAKTYLRGLFYKILTSSSQFYEIQSGGWLTIVLHVTKTKTVRKRELNL